MSEQRNQPIEIIERVREYADDIRQDKQMFDSFMLNNLKGNL